MNQFKVGDTVWTVKRGKGKIVEDYSKVAKRRPYEVDFGTCTRNPKLSNLCRSPAEMIESKRKAKLLKGKRTVTIDFSCLEPIDPHKPKFKRGDKVYYEGKKWSIQSDYGAFCLVPINRLNEYGNTQGTYVIESDLRLWKEHELTHCLQHAFDTWYESDYDVSKYKSIEFIGNICGHDTFLITTETGSKNLFRGKKGDIEI